MMNREWTENEIAKEVVDVAVKIHMKLGPGLLESVYETIMEYELAKRGLHVERQIWVPIKWESLTFEEGFRTDLWIERKVIVELKSIKKLTDVDFKQILTHIRLAEMKLGFLINFGEALIKNGIHRIANGIQDE